MKGKKKEVRVGRPFSVYLSREVIAGLTVAAKAQDRSRSYLVNKAVAEYIERLGA